MGAIFKEAESALSEAELIHGDLAVPSINQLRYAGHHMVAMMEPTCADPEEEMRKAKRHCQRAIYDAFDSSIVYLLRSIIRFKEDYCLIEISPHFPEYLGGLAKAREAQKLITSTRSDSDNRHNHYLSCRKIAQELHEFYEATEIAREELNKAVRIRNRNDRLTAAGVVIAFVACVAGIISVIPKHTVPDIDLPKAAIISPKGG